MIRSVWFWALGAAIALPACGSSVVMSGVAVGKVGRGLSAHAGMVPQGATVCAMQDAIATPTGAAEKPLAETCSKARRSDRVYRGALIALSAYSAKLESLATGSNPETAGQLEAALTGVKDATWTEADAGQDQSTRDAVTQLVTQIGTNTNKSDLDKTVKDAAPHVKTLCDGLGLYLDAQLTSLGQVQKEVDKKRSTHADRRCGTVSTQTVCVSESVIDRLAYSSSFSQIEAIESSHMAARDSVSAFCAAHRKAEEAAANGQFSKEKTYGEIVEAVKSANRSQPPAAANKK
jgi:hypothetical protein